MKQIQGNILFCFKKPEYKTHFDLCQVKKKIFFLVLLNSSLPYHEKKQRNKIKAIVKYYLINYQKRKKRVILSKRETHRQQVLINEKHKAQTTIFGGI